MSIYYLNEDCKHNEIIKIILTHLQDSSNLSSNQKNSLSRTT